MEAKVRDLQAAWILKFVQGRLTGSLNGIIRDLVLKWALLGNNRHFLNDPDDNREFVGSAPLAEIIFSWSKIVKPEPRLDQNNWVARIVRKSEKEGISETLGHIYKVLRVC